MFEIKFFQVSPIRKGDVALKFIHYAINILKKLSL